MITESDLLNRPIGAYKMSPKNAMSVTKWLMVASLDTMGRSLRILDKTSCESENMESV